ncbi:hypothetical protein GIB67_003826, partial [Kingdonia uniflora]
MCKEGMVKKAHEGSGTKHNYPYFIDERILFAKQNEAAKVFHSMVNKDLKPNIIIYNILINGYCKTKNLDEAMQILEDMCNKGLAPNTITYSSLIEGLCKSTNLDEAKKFFDSLPSKNLK